MDYEKLSGDRVGESSEAIRARVQAARDIQNKRFSSNGPSGIMCNADMRVGEIRQFCKLQDEGQSLMRAAMTQLDLSGRRWKMNRPLLVGNDQSFRQNEATFWCIVPTITRILEIHIAR